MTNIEIAEQALRHFDPQADRARAAVLLRLWQPRSWMLDAADELAVLARFDGSPWPASVVWRDRP